MIKITVTEDFMGLNDVIVEIILICIFAVLGLMYLSGKCNFLIPKYRLLSDEMKNEPTLKSFPDFSDSLPFSPLCP